jgi:hypothetical protein
MMYGGILITTGLVCYIVNIFFLRYYLDKNAPGLLKTDAILPPPKKNEEYLWEKTAGTGMVPRWVSLIGVLSIPLLVIGVIVVLIGLFI